MSKSPLTFWHYAALAVLVYLSFYFGITHYPLNNDNEGLYAEIAREMILTGNYVIPHLNYVPYIEKPPLLYWLVTVAYHIFGVNTFSARIIPALAATSVSITMLWFGKKTERMLEAWIGAVIFTTCIGVIIISRMLFFDMLLTALMAIALLQFYLWDISEKKSYLRWSYFFLALVFLTKGFVGVVLIFLIAYTYLAINRDWKKMKAVWDSAGIMVFLVIVTPWHIFAAMRQSGFLWDYFINEQLFRFFNARLPHDYYTGPIYYYLPRILIYLFPWSLLLPLFLRRVRLDKRSLFFLLWLLIPLLFFSLSEAKANYYMIIGMPPLVLLLATRVTRIFESCRTAIFVFAWFVLFMMVVFSKFYIQKFTNASDPVLHEVVLLSHLWIPLFLIYSFLGFIWSLVACVVTQKLQRNFQNQSLKQEVLRLQPSYFWVGYTLLFSLVGMTLLILTFAYQLTPKIADQLSETSLVQYLKQQPDGVPVYVYQDYVKLSSLFFYLDRRFPMIDSETPDLQYGSTTPEAWGWFMTTDQFLKEGAKENCFVVMPQEDLDEFRETTKGSHFCTVHESGKGVILSNDSELCAKT